MSDLNQIRLILLRHGNTFETGQTPVQVGAKTDMPLTEKGLSQALDFAKYLKQKNIVPKAIYAGTLKRQTESAKLIADELHIQQLVHTGEIALNEVDYGIWEGLTQEEIQAKWNEEYEAWNKRGIWADKIFHGSHKNHLKSISSWLDILNDSYKNQDVIVGLTSQGAIRFFTQLATCKKIDISNLKVKTGHFCELLITKTDIEIISWDVSPKTFLEG